MGQGTGDRVGVRVGIGCWGRTGDSLLGGRALDVVPLLPGIAGLPLLGIGCIRWRTIAGCRCWLPLLGDRGGWVYKLADWMW